MLQVLLILLETGTSTVLYTDMNIDIGSNINIAKKCSSPIQMESTSAYVHSIVLYTDMNADIGANSNIANIAQKCSSLIQMESASAYVCTHIFIFILVQALVPAALSVLELLD